MDIDTATFIACKHENTNIPSVGTPDNRQQIQDTISSTQGLQHPTTVA